MRRFNLKFPGKDKLVARLNKSKTRLVRTLKRNGKRDIVKLAAVLYGLGCYNYGPLDTLKVAYSVIDSSVKESDFREAQALYAKRLGKTSLTPEDQSRLYQDLGLVAVDGEWTPNWMDIKYSNLLDYIEAQRDYMNSGAYIDMTPNTKE